MPRTCSICSRVDVAALNELVRGGQSARSVARQHGLSEDAFDRHVKNHLGDRARGTKAQVIAPLAAGVDPLAELIEKLRTRALAGNPNDTREYRLALAAQQAERASSIPAHDLAHDPEWIALRSLVLAALAPYPEARLAVANAIRSAGDPS
jgi:hypothetical protein